MGVLISDVAGRICHTNEVVTRIFRCNEPMERDSYGEVLGWWDSSGRMIKGKDGPLARALQGKASHNEVLHIRCFDGADKTILGSASPLYGLDKSIV